MKAFGSFTFGFLLTCGLAAQLTAAPQFGRNRSGSQGSGTVCLYRDINYQGTEECFRDGDTVSTLQGLNHQVSSIRINGRMGLTVYDSTNFRGHSITFNQSMPDLGQVRLESKSWSDRIESLQVGAGNAATSGPVYGGSYPNQYPYPNPNQYPYPNQSPTQQISNGICVFDRRNYQGRSECWSSGEQLGDLARVDRWNDRIASIRVFGRTSAVAYSDIGFNGASFVIDRDMPDVGRSWNHQISSIRIGNNRAFGDSRGYGRDRRRN